MDQRRGNEVVGPNLCCSIPAETLESQPRRASGVILEDKETAMRPTINLTMPQHIVLFLNGNVVRIDPLTGQVVWATKQPKGIHGRFATILIDGDVVLVGTNGHLFALDVEDGRILWLNELKGMGFGLVSVATGNGQGSNQSAMQGAASAAATAAAAAAIAAAAGTAAAG